MYPFATSIDCYQRWRKLAGLMPRGTNPDLVGTDEALLLLLVLLFAFLLALVGELLGFRLLQDLGLALGETLLFLGELDHLAGELLHLALPTLDCLLHLVNED